MRFSPKGPGFHIRHQTALDQEGSTLAVRVQIQMDGGCYPPKNSQALRQAVHSAWGAYQVSNLEVIGRSVRTDFPPIGPLRASGEAQVFFAAELHMEYHTLVEDHRIGLPTVHLETDFRRPFSYGDNIEVEVRVLDLGRTSVTLGYRVFKPGEADARIVGRQVTVCIDMDDFTKIEIPEWLRARLQNYAGATAA